MNTSIICPKPYTTSNEPSAIPCGITYAEAIGYNNFQILRKWENRPRDVKARDEMRSDDDISIYISGRVWQVWHFHGDMYFFCWFLNLNWNDGWCTCGVIWCDIDFVVGILAIIFCFPLLLITIIQCIRLIYYRGIRPFVQIHGMYVFMFLSAASQAIR